MVFHAKQRTARGDHRNDQPPQSHPAVASGHAPPATQDHWLQEGRIADETGEAGEAGEAGKATEKAHRLERRCHEKNHGTGHTPLPTDRAALLRQLSAQMQAIELGSELANAHTQSGTSCNSNGPTPLGTGWPQADSILRRGSVHDIFASLGSAPSPSIASAPSTPPAPSTPLAPPPQLDDTPPLLMLTHIAACALRTGPGRLVLWIGQRVWPSVHALIEPDDPRRLLLASSVLINPPDDAARLWAIDLALRSPAVAAVVADGRALDLAATRRLQLAASSGRTAIGLLVRGIRDAGQLSAAGARWHVAPVPVPRQEASTNFPSRTMFGGRPTIAPIYCRPRLAVTLEHCKGMQLAQSHSLSPSPLVVGSAAPDSPRKPTWIVEQSRGPLCVCVSSSMAAGCTQTSPDAPGHPAHVSAVAASIVANAGPAGSYAAHPPGRAASA